MRATHGSLIPRPDRVSNPTYLLDLPFVLIAPGNGGDLRGLMDDHLNDAGQSRFVRLSTPHFTTLPGLIAGQRAVAFAPRKVLTALTLPDTIAVISSPVSNETFEIGLMWHQRTHRDPASHWLRELFIEASAGRQTNVVRRAGC